MAGSNTQPMMASDTSPGLRGYQEDRSLIDRFPAMDEAGAREFLEASVAAMVAETKDHREYGSTFTGAVVTEKGNIVTAHLGDSPAAAIIYDPKTQKAEYMPLIKPHTPSEEYTEFTGENGRQWFEEKGRIFGVFLAMNRSLGNSEFLDAVKHEADFTQHDLSQFHADGKKIFLLVASDGALLKDGETSTLEGHKHTIEKELKHDPNTPLSHLAQEMVRNSAASEDNATVNLMEVVPGKPAVSAIFDGHCTPKQDGKHPSDGAKTADAALNIFRQMVNGVNVPTPAAEIGDVAEQQKFMEGITIT